jgi:hypothetical protein
MIKLHPAMQGRASRASCAKLKGLKKIDGIKKD